MGVIAWDCDGPIADMVGGLCLGLQARGFPVLPADIVHYSLTESLVPRFGTAANRTAREIMAEPGFCYRLPVVFRALARLEYLRKKGHHVICVTSPYSSATWTHERTTWLQEKAGFSSQDILFVHGPLKRLVRADYLIEDHPGNAAAWCEENPNGQALLLERFWNTPEAKEYTTHPRMVRVQDDALLDILR